MNTKFFATALIAAASFAAAPGFAADSISGEVGYVPPAPVASRSDVSRAAVRADYLQAQRNDALAPRGEGADLGYAAVASTRSRQDVKSEYLQAARSQQLAPRGEGADIGHVASSSVRSRDAVHAEAVRALRAGRLTGGEV